MYRFFYFIILFLAFVVSSQLYGMYLVSNNVFIHTWEFFGYRLFSIKDYVVYSLPFSSYTDQIYVDAVYKTGYPILYAAVIIIFLEFFIMLIRNKNKLKNKNIHGSAKWATKKDLFLNNLLGNKGVVIGQLYDAKYKIKGNDFKLRKTSNLIANDSFEHKILIAPTGTGKGVGPVQSTLLCYPSSVLVIDPKGENDNLTSGFRSHFSIIYRLNFTSFDGTSYNPFHDVRKGQYFVKDIQNIFQSIFDTETTGTGSEWQTYAYNMTVSLTYFLVYLKGLENVRLFDILDFLNDSKYSDMDHLFESMKNIDDKEIVSIFDHQYPEFNKSLNEFVLNEIRKAGREYLDLNANTRTSITATMGGKLRVFDDPMIRLKIDKSDFHMIDLKTSKYPVTLYIIVAPDDIMRLRPLLNIIINISSNILTEKENKYYDNPHKVLFLIDEFMQLGKSKTIPLGLSIYRSYGIEFFGIIQSFEQIFETYGKNPSFLSNIQLLIVYGTQSEADSKLISEMLGKETVENDTVSSSKDKNTLFGVSSSGGSKSFTGKYLLDPSEIKTMSKDTGILFYAGMYPYRFKKIRTYLDPRFKHLLGLPERKRKIKIVTTKNDIVLYNLTDDDIEYYDNYIQYDESNIIDIIDDASVTTISEDDLFQTSYMKGGGVPGEEA